MAVGDLQRQTIEVLETALRRRVYDGPTPEWLLRPGRDECGPEWRRVRLIYRRLSGGLELAEVMGSRETRIVDGIIGGRGVPWRIFEFDESQHFNEFRAMTLGLYPSDLALGYPKRVWVEASRRGRASQGGGFARPTPLFRMAGGRHRQRAFRDALADLLPAHHGFAPTLRIADFEVKGWIWERGAGARLARLIEARLETES